MSWIIIKVKHTGRCCKCKEWINQGDYAFWEEGTGIKHLECPEPLQEDDSRLVVIDDDDKKMLGIK